MSACEKCMHLAECFEQRGRCASFKTLKQWKKERRQEIEMLNQNTTMIYTRRSGEEQKKVFNETIDW